VLKTIDVRIIHDPNADTPYRIIFPRDRDKKDVYRKSEGAALNVVKKALRERTLIN